MLLSYAYVQQLTLILATDDLTHLTLIDERKGELVHDGSPVFDVCGLCRSSNMRGRGLHGTDHASVGLQDLIAGDDRTARSRATRRGGGRGGRGVGRGGRGRGGGKVEGAEG